MNSILKDPDPLWYSWFAGFVDGEGYFQIMAQEDRVRGAALTIRLRADDTYILEEIHSVLRCGRLNHIPLDKYDYPDRNNNPQTSWRVTKRMDLATIIIPLLDRYPLKTKKRAGYLIWRQAVHLLYEKIHLTEDGHRHILSLKNKLMEQRAFAREQSSRR